MKLIFSFLLINLLLISCTSKHRELKEDEYIAFMKKGNNGLQVSKEIKELEFSVQYVPADYQLITQLGTTSGKSETEVIAIQKELSRFHHLILKINTIEKDEILKYAIRSEQDYFQRIEYLSSKIADDIILIHDKDTFACSLAHYEPSYGLSPYIVVNLYFNYCTVNSDLIIRYNDRLFGIGPILLRLRENNIKNIPHLKY